jgi:spermidine/putrescine transport system permease protein
MSQRSPLRLLSVFAVLYLVFLYLPVLLLPLFSFNDNTLVALPLRGFTTQWYVDLLADKALLNALWASVRIGIPVAFLSTVFGLLAAMAMTRYNFAGKRLVSGLIMLPLLIPVLILGISLLTMVRKIFALELSLWTVGAGQIMLCIPFSMLVLMARLEGFDRSLEEASWDLGQNSLQTFWRVTVPLALPGIVASFLLCFITSFDEFILAFFLSGTEPTLPIYIFSQLRFPNRLPRTLALGSCVLLASVIVVIFAEWIRRRGLDKNKLAGT